MNKIFASPIGSLTADDDKLVLRKYGKQFLLFGNKVVQSEKTVQYHELFSVDIGTLSKEVGFITFNLKKHMSKLALLISNPYTFYFEPNDIEQYLELKHFIDRKNN
jgi:hypothetical protein